MQKRKLQIFLSSTYEDLIGHRLAAMEAILAAGHIPSAMEQFSAGDDTAWDRIRGRIDESDAFILILGGRYGSIEPTSGKSYVQLEYEYAVERHKPHFALIITDEHLRERVKLEDLEKVDERDHRDLYLAFKSQVTLKLCKFWSDKKDITAAIFQKLPEWAQREDLVGWIRADEAATPEVTNELARLSQENHELRARTANTSYAGLSFDELRALLSAQSVVPANAQVLTLLGCPADWAGGNFLDVFRSVAEVLAQGEPMWPRRDKQVASLLHSLATFGLIEYNAREGYELTDDGRAFRNRLLHESLPPIPEG